MLPQLKSEFQSSAAILAEAKNHFYSCRFADVIQRIDDTESNSLDERTYIELQLLKGSALIELLQAAQGRIQIQRLSAEYKFQCRASYHYTLGRDAYLSGDYDQAIALFQSIMRVTEEPVLLFRGYLGVANVLYSTERYSDIPPYLAQLDILKNKVNHEDRISYLILLGNYYRSSGKDCVLARKYFSLAMQSASKQGWIYFFLRALYGLTTIAELEVHRGEYATFKNLLFSLVEDSEAIHFRDLCRTRFGTRNQVVKPAFDQQSFTVYWRDERLNLVDAPAVFKFLQTLTSCQNFATKQEIAQKVWSHERYLPRTHDPRIFDLAKRIRGLLRSKFGGEWELMSGRMGYKLTQVEKISEMRTTHD